MKLLQLLNFVILFCLFPALTFAQISINEGCNKNGNVEMDENGDYPDWIELYNSSASNINLLNWKLSDQAIPQTAWSLPNVNLGANSFVRIFCSGKNKFGTPPFLTAGTFNNFQPSAGWNTHQLSSNFIWDGSSNLLINVCSYNGSGYTENSVFYQSTTAYSSCMASFVDGSPAACSNNAGQIYYQRPNIKLNNVIIGTGTVTNSNTDYPAPYGNWYWGARHQILIRANELIAAGLTPGPISTLAFQVASTNSEFYDYIEISLNQTQANELSSEFYPLQGQQLHTNFKLDGQGESVYLYDPSSVLKDQLEVRCPQPNVSVGRFPNGATNIVWMQPTVAQSNNNAVVYTDTLSQPQISLQGGLYSGAQSVSISANFDPAVAKLVYTLNGQDPTSSSAVYTSPITISSNKVLRARVVPLNSNSNLLPSDQAVASYVFNIAHTTPILLVSTPNTNLFGASGIFDNWAMDWLRPAHAILLDTGATHPALIQGKAAIRVDGGAGGSRSQPQHSFRLIFNHGIYGNDSWNLNLLPDRPNRSKYSEIYLRNGSNQYLKLPYKDAAQVRMMSEGTHNYYSSYRPVSVYINGAYFGLYELREKFNAEYFEQHDNANRDSVELLSLSYWYNLILRAVEGDVNNFWNAYDSFNALDPSQANYWEAADQYFDMKHYTDYIIAESWMGNVDWPGNNIKIYRSDQTNMRWRFALIDLELSLQPNGWTNCTDNHLNHMLGQPETNPYINIWKQSIQNIPYRNYFINRFADLMNTSYSQENLLATEQKFYESMLPEMPLEFARWGDPNNIAAQMDAFTADHEMFRDQLLCRSTFVFNQLLQTFNLSKKVQVQLDVYPAEAGTIQLNSIEPQILPWNGTYFDGVPVELIAHAKPGYEFSHWIAAANISDSLQDSLEVNVTDNTQTFTAVFKVVPLPPAPQDLVFQLQPNPSNHLFVLANNAAEAASQCTLVVRDIHGRDIRKIKLPNQSNYELDLLEERAGIYWIEIYKDNQRFQVLKALKI
ncbi:MAG: CotH kinase family protein [Flavobacteriales bacterium]